MPGVAATTIDEALAASSTRADEVLSWQRLRLEKVDSFRGLYQWWDAMVQRCALRRGLWGCELGSLAAELSDSDDRARESLSEHFTERRTLLGDALERMRGNGMLRAEANTRTLATRLLAAVEGGYLLSQTRRDARLMQAALDMAIWAIWSSSIPVTVESMKLRVLPYVTVEVDDRLRRRLRAKGERLRLNVRAYLLSAADDVDTASDKVRGLCDRAVDRLDAAVAGLNDKIAPSEAPTSPHLVAVREAG